MMRVQKLVVLCYIFLPKVSPFRAIEGSDKFIYVLEIPQIPH